MSATKKRTSVVIFVCIALAGIWFVLSSKEKRITERTTEELAEFLGARGYPYLTSKYFSQEDVPALMALLEDPKYVLQWSKAMVIASAVDKQHVSQPHLIRYLKTDYSLVFHDSGDRDRHSLTRVTALTMLGHVADEQGIELLETIALSTEGLYSVTNDWIHKPLLGGWEKDREQYIAMLRAKAALGLVYSQNQSSIALIETLHLDTVDTLKTAMDTHKFVEPSYMQWIAAFNNEEAISMFLHGGLVSALSARDAIEEIGMEEFRTGTGHGIMTTLELIGPHMDKYRMY